MTHKLLYFIPILARALERPDDSKGLRDALTRIEELGRELDYKEGFRQFRTLVSLVESLAKQTGADQDASSLPRETLFEIELWSDERRIASIDLGASTTHVVGNIRPGNYCLTLSSGRVLWQAELESRHLYWTDAFPGEPIPAAAQTGEDIPVISPETHPISIQDLVVQVRPGIDAGELRIEYLPGVRK